MKWKLTLCTLAAVVCSTVSQGASLVTSPTGFVDVSSVNLGLAASSFIQVSFPFPVSATGFDFNLSGGGTVSNFALSNGDAVSPSSTMISGSGFVGVTDLQSFTVFSFQYSGATGTLVDLRFTPAAPEPATIALVAPLLLAGFAMVRWRKQSY